MPEITIIVDFETLDGREAEFTTLMLDHASRTLDEEPGCLRFEVIKPIETDGTPLPNRLVVNELYADDAALAAHEKNPRLHVLRTTTAPLLKSRHRITARSLDRSAEASLTTDQLNASNDE